MSEQPEGEGWVPFGTHAYCGVMLEFADVEGDGLPRWERLIFEHDMAISDLNRLRGLVDALSARLRAVQDFVEGEPPTHGDDQAEGYWQALSDLYDLLEQGDNQ